MVENFPLNSADAAYTKIRGMLSTLGDPFTRIISPKEYQGFRIGSDGNLQGVGLFINIEPRTGHLHVQQPEKFRLTRQTSFGRRHLSVWTTNPILIWIVCFFRQFVCSVPKVDYLTLRHGFVTAHLAPQNHQKFDFMQYIERTLEEDFEVVVEIRFM
ncbi:MLO-like protein 6 isoform X2 [Arachis duranensis]|uniref:MLO-like protein 6 isoform X2 n=1 Tax=Arachis duranensis TaxID=130453 RepID=A0A9C6TK73_ARADU|nr:MLO-like protein 6 isoform X2 [Arachis duranensis]